MEATSVPPSAPQGGVLSLPQRFWGIFTSPAAVFLDLKARPRILGALVLLAVVWGAAGVALGPAMEADRQKAFAERSEDMNEEEVAQAERVMKITARLSPVLFVAGGVVTVVVVAGILLLISNLVLGGNASYREMLSGLGHASFVNVIQFAVIIPLALSRGTMDVSTSLAALLPGGADKGFLYFTLAQFDVFHLWELILSVLVVSVMGGIATRRAGTGVIGAWVLWSLVWITLQTLVSGLGGS